MFLWCACLLGTGTVTGAWAQQAPGPRSSADQGLEEIVVTAQRRSENVQNVPIAVTNISAAQLEQMAATNSLDVVRLVPNMFGANNTGLGTANTYSIRGLNNTESIATFDAPVGTYVDDVYIARQNANNFALFDVDHVEVLSGPQGTLFGRNTTGGAVSIQLKKPAAELGGFVEAGFGNFSEHSVRGSVDIPLSPTVLTKVSGYYVKDDGFVHDTTTGQTLNGNDNKGVRVALRWLASASVTWDLSADYVDQDYMNILATPTANGDRVSAVGLNTNFSWYPTLWSGPKSNYPLGNRVLEHSITSNVQWKTDFGTLDFLTGWRDMEQKFFIDFFDSPLPVVQNAGANGGEFLIANEGRHTQFSQEIKFTGSAFGDRLSYVTGIFYLNEMNRTDLGQAFVLPGGVVPNGFCLPNAVAVCSIPTAVAGQYETLFEPFFYDHNVYNTTHSWALYGQGDYKLADPLTLTVGARYTDETKGIEFTPNPNQYASTVNQFTTADMIAAGIPTQQSIKILTPRVALRYDFSPDLNVYASATRGFKGGGWNGRSATAALALPFAPEKTWSYELGLRSEWLDHKLRANLTAFYSDTQNFQLPTAYVPPGGGADVFITGNFAGLTVHGLEAEITAAPIDGLTLFANLGWQQGHYQDLSAAVISQQQKCLAEITAGGATADCGQGIVDSRGGIAEPVRLPTHSVKLGASYVIHLGFADLTPNVSLENLGQFDVDTASANPDSRNNGYTEWAAGLTLSSAEAGKSGWSVQAGCTNCSDRVVLAAKLPPTLYYQDPRRWSALLKYRF